MTPQLVEAAEKDTLLLPTKGAAETHVATLLAPVPLRRVLSVVDHVLRILRGEPEVDQLYNTVAIVSSIVLFIKIN